MADVLDTYADDRVYSRLDGDAAVQVAITKQPDANTVRVVDGCTRVLDRLRRDDFFPPDVETQVIQDQAFYVRSAVNGVAKAALVGGGLAMLVVFLFLRSVRRTLVIGTSVPIALLGCVALMGGADLTLNIMSLGGLALGIGMLVDNSIVMLENIDRHQREGGDPQEAAHVGAGEVASAVTASTMTNLAAVVPFFLMGGLTALLFNELLLTISFAILTSLVVALTLVPMLSAQLFKLRSKSRAERSRWLGFRAGHGRARRGQLPAPAAVGAAPPVAGGELCGSPFRRRPCGHVDGSATSSCPRSTTAGCRSTSRCRRRRRST